MAVAEQEPRWVRRTRAPWAAQHWCGSRARAMPIPCAGHAGVSFEPLTTRKSLRGWNVSREGNGAGERAQPREGSSCSAQLPDRRVEPAVVRLCFQDKGSSFRWQRWSPHPCRDLKATEMQHVGAWLSGGLSSAGLTVYLEDQDNLTQ